MIYMWIMNCKCFSVKSEKGGKCNAFSFDALYFQKGKNYVQKAKKDMCQL